MRGGRAVTLVRGVRRLVWVLLGVWGVCVGASAQVYADTAGDGRYRYEADRIVAVGDVHGAYDALTTILRAAGLIDEDHRWSGGTTHLVSLGDLLDRGPHSRKVMDLLMALQREAPDAGGRVHVVLGNHELMNLTGDLRYVSDEEFAAFADDAADPEGLFPRGFLGLNAAFAPDGTYGSWLLAQPSAVVINDIAFVHGGLPEGVTDLPPAELNAASRSNLMALLSLRAELEAEGVIEPWQGVEVSAERLAPRLAGGEWAKDRGGTAVRVARFIELAEHDLFSPQGVQWYRGTAACHHLLERPVLESVLRSWGARRVVVGHTPTPDRRIRMRLGGLAVLTDTGMLAEYYRGRPSALIVEGESLQSLYPDAPALPGEPELWNGMEIDGRHAEELYARLQEAGLTIADPAAAAASDGGGTGPPGSKVMQLGGGGSPEESSSALFQPASRAEVSRHLAAYRLDRMLDLDLVLPTVDRVVDGRRGVVSAIWEQTLTESERDTRGLWRPNWCGDRSDYQLMYVFDGLIGNGSRTPATMLYDQRTWQLGLVGHGDTFGRGRDLPAYLNRTPATIPPALADALRKLDSTSLERELGELLSVAQRRAILERRDRLLSTWTVGY
jgi:hypothetical protein